MHSRSCAGDRFVEKHSNGGGDDAANDVDDGDDDDVDLNEIWCSGMWNRRGILKASAGVVSSREMTVKVAEISNDVIMSSRGGIVWHVEITLPTGNKYYYLWG